MRERMVARRSVHVLFESGKGAVCFWTLEYGVSGLRGPPEGPKGCHLDARGSSRGLSKVSLTTPTIQTVQDSWKGPGTRHASGVWVFFGDSVNHPTVYGRCPHGGDQPLFTINHELIKSVSLVIT